MKEKSAVLQVKPPTARLRNYKQAKGEFLRGGVPMTLLWFGKGKLAVCPHAEVEGAEGFGGIVCCGGCGRAFAAWKKAQFRGPQPLAFAWHRLRLLLGRF